MSIETFIPEVWSAKLQMHLDKSYVLGGLVNRDYEGEIAQYGDTVHIGQMTNPTIGDYTRHNTTNKTGSTETIIDPENLTMEDQTLVINQSKYFAFEVDDIDERQARDGGALLNSAAQRSAVKLAEALDTHVGGLMTSNAGSVLTAAAVSTGEAAYTVIRKLRLELDKKNVPGDSRFVVCSPDFYSLLLDSAKFIDASQYGNSAPVQAGEVGRILGFSVMVSTNMPTGTVGTGTGEFVVAGHRMATTLAEQISKVEAYRPEAAFTDALKGLHLYGAKVIEPAALAVQCVDAS